MEGINEVPTLPSIPAVEYKRITNEDKIGGTRISQAEGDTSIYVTLSRKLLITV